MCIRDRSNTLAVAQEAAPVSYTHLDVYKRQPQYWTFWVGLFLVVLVLVGRDRLFRPWTWFGAGRKAGAASNTGGH